MANNDEPTGHNVKLDDDDFVIDPSRMKSKKNKAVDTPPPAPSYSSYTPPASVAPPPPPPPEPIMIQVVAPQPQPQTTYDPNAAANFMNNQQNFMQSQATAQVQAQASVGLAQTSIDKEIVEKQMAKEEEHWAKSFWRPAMGWLYMVICFMDFVGFPLLTIFLPIIFKPFGLVMPYTAWQSLTLSNGGLIHLAFGAILGVSAFSRGQEKLAQR